MTSECVRGHRTKAAMSSDEEVDKVRLPAAGSCDATCTGCVRAHACLHQYRRPRRLRTAATHTGCHHLAPSLGPARAAASRARASAALHRATGTALFADVPRGRLGGGSALTTARCAALSRLDSLSPGALSPCAGQGGHGGPRPRHGQEEEGQARSLGCLYICCTLALALRICHLPLPLAYPAPHSARTREQKSKKPKDDDDSAAAKSGETWLADGGKARVPTHEAVVRGPGRLLARKHSQGKKERTDHAEVGDAR